jgi:hypothetical protein
MGSVGLILTLVFVTFTGAGIALLVMLRMGPRTAAVSCERITRMPTTPRCCARHSVQQLGEVLERSRRLAAAEERIDQELARLPRGWLVERRVLVDSYRVPYVIAGSGGLFAVTATDGAWTLRDLDLLASAAEHLRGQVPGYAGEVHAVVCLAFDPSEPRLWHGAEIEWRGGWVLGVDQLWSWLASRESMSGFSEHDVETLAIAARPDWRRQSIVRLPGARAVG